MKTNKFELALKKYYNIKEKYLKRNKNYTKLEMLFSKILHNENKNNTLRE